MTRITEDYVSFEVAKLLKEKGFNEETECVYSNGGELLKLSHLGIKDLTNANCNDYHTWQFPIEGVASIISAPTLQMAMKWLREVHKIHIQIWILEDNGYWFDIEKILNAQYKHKSLYSTGLEDIYFKSHEQACEAAIKYCLEHLI